MHRGVWHGIAVLLAIAPFPAPAPAQQMYRCGSTYSQTPCSPTATATRTRSDVPPDNAGGSQSGAACAASASRAEVIQYSGQPVVALRYDLSITTVSPAGVWLAARAYSCYLSEDQQRILKFEIRRQ
jgi:hypothetical protein